MNTNEMIKQVEEEVRKELKGIMNEDALGYIHCFEERKKEKLKEKGIPYQTIRERNTGILVD